MNSSSNIDVEEIVGIGDQLEEEREGEGMEVVIMTSEDFSRLVQIQSVEEHWEISQDMESQQIIHSVVETLGGNDDEEMGQGSEQCSQIIQIAFDSIVQTGDGGADAGEMATSDTQLTEHTIVTEGETGGETQIKEVDDQVPGTDEIEMVEILDDDERTGESDRAQIEIAHLSQTEKPVNVVKYRYQADLCCIICGESFSDKETLKVHRMSHAEEELLACAVCDLKFCERRRLSLHMLQHTNKDEPHECECGKRFRHESAWRRHNDKFHITDFSGPTACSVCRKVFKSEAALRRHDQILHQGAGALVKDVVKESPLSNVQYSCTKCSLSFSNELTLARHCEAKHSGYLCYYCDQVFMNKMLLRQHSKDVHNPERPYACYKCWKRFTNGPEAKAHLTEAHNVNMVRPVGLGRQKGDMYSTNFYDKTKLIQTAILQPKSKSDTPRQNSAKDNLNMIPVDPTNPNDLAARLKGRLSDYPRLVAKRKTKYTPPVTEPQSPIRDSYLTPCFTPPIEYKPPGIHIRKTKWGASLPGESEKEREDSELQSNSSPTVQKPTLKINVTSVKTNRRPVKSRTRESMRDNSGMKLKQTRGINSHIKNSVKNAKAGRRRVRPMSASVKESRGCVDLHLKKPVVVLTRLPATVVQKYHLENTEPSSKRLSGNELGCGKVISTSPSSKLRLPSLNISDRPRRNVKSIYQTRVNSSQHISNRHSVQPNQVQFTISPKPTPVITTPEDKRSSPRRRGNTEKKSSETPRLPELATASQLLQIMTNATIPATTERLEGCGNKLAEDSNQNCEQNVERVFQNSKLQEETPEQLLQLKTRLPVASDMESGTVGATQHQSNSTFMKIKLRTLSSVEPELV